MSKLLILDIDETLVHATEAPLSRDCDFETDLYYVYKRPYLDEFLSFCFAQFTVAIWTTAGKEFAEQVVETVVKKHGEPVFLWSYERCTKRLDPHTYETLLIKNLDKVKKRGYRLESVIMVDDTPQKLSKHYGNLVRVGEYTGQDGDKELLKLIKYLEHLKPIENIRKVEKRGWQSKYDA